MASFMSGMAGNVTAFNTVCTYDIYQSYIRRNAPDTHYLWVGRMATVVRHRLSIGAAYLAHTLQQHHGPAAVGLRLRERSAVCDLPAGHVLEAAPPGHGAFAGLAPAPAPASLTHGLTMAEGKGGWIGPSHQFPSTMAQNFWIAIVRRRFVSW